MVPSSFEDDRLSAFLSDRPKFKLYAAAQHLNNLRSIEARYESLVAPTARIQAEIQIDSFLEQILGIPIEQLDFGRVQSALSAKTKKIDLLSDLDRARQYGNWYWQLIELRNYSMRASLIAKVVVVGPDHPAMIFFKKDPRDPDNSPPMELEVIPYFGQCLSSMERLIERIRNSDPMLV
jgi:hypothetical protein